MSSGIRLVSDDGSAAVAPVMFTETQFEVAPATKTAVQDAFSTQPTPGVEVDFSTEIASGIPSILGGGELVGLVIAAIVLIAMLGTLVGAGLPILSALVGVGIGVLAALSLSGVVEMVSVTPVLGVMLGLAVGIDYSLFIVNRHRRQLKEGYSLRESISLATGTSGNAVVFAGMTVFIALLGLNVTGIPFLGVMGTVGAVCVAIAVLIAVTFTPAMLGLMGERVLNGRERTALTSEAAPAVAKPVRAMSTRRAIGSVLLGVAVLGALAVPAMSMRLGLPDGSSEASGSTQYQAYTTVAEKFGAGVNGPLLVVADLPGPRRRTRSSPSRSASGGSSPRSTVSSRSPRSGRRPTGPRSPSRSSPPTDRRASPRNSWSRSSGQRRLSRAASRSPWPGRPAGTSTSRRSWRTPSRSTSRSSSDCHCSSWWWSSGRSSSR